MAKSTTTVNYENFEVGESELPKREHMKMYCSSPLNNDYP